MLLQNKLPRLQQHCFCSLRYVQRSISHDLQGSLNHVFQWILDLFSIIFADLASFAMTRAIARAIPNMLGRAPCAMLYFNGMAGATVCGSLKRCKQACFPAWHVANSLAAAIAKSRCPTAIDTLHRLSSTLIACITRRWNY